MSHNRSEKIFPSPLFAKEGIIPPFGIREAMRDLQIKCFYYNEG